MLELNESLIQNAYRRNELGVQSKFKLMNTIVGYVINDIKTKTRSFSIGVCTVFLVVSFITALKSQIDIVPIALLKVGQDQDGAIDFRLKCDVAQRIVNGDTNFYQNDPFNISYGLSGDPFLY